MPNEAKRSTMTLFSGCATTTISTTSADSHSNPRLTSDELDRLKDHFKSFFNGEHQRPSANEASSSKPTVTCLIPVESLHQRRLEHREEEQLCGRSSSQNSGRILFETVRPRLFTRLSTSSDPLVASPSANHTSAQNCMFVGGGGIITTKSPPPQPNFSSVVTKSLNGAGGGSVCVLNPVSPPAIAPTADSISMSPFDFLKKFNESKQATSSNSSSSTSIGKTFCGGFVEQVSAADATTDANVSARFATQLSVGLASVVHCSGGSYRSSNTMDSVDGGFLQHATNRRTGAVGESSSATGSGTLRRESSSSIARSLASFFTRALSRGSRDADASGGFATTTTSSVGKGSGRRYSRPVKITQFISRVRDLEADTAAIALSKEFDCLQGVGREKPCTAALMPYNLPKNRFANILPYDHSRVVLLPMPPATAQNTHHNRRADAEQQVPGGDYINASYIPGYHSRREFIASQGVLASTRNDFWRMVWQQDVRAIIMLTKCIEAEQEKCNHYWPHDSRPMLSGDIQIMQISESHENNWWTVREFTVSKDDESRTIQHWHFTGWPDFGLPDNPQKLLKFLEAFRQQNSPSDMARFGPIVCHCSAGVGRTGTFIAVDRVLQLIKHAEYEQNAAKTASQRRPHSSASVTFPSSSASPNSAASPAAAAVGGMLLDTYGDISIDIFGIVCEMRRERCTMVQTDQQYLFIYQCIAKVLESRCGVRRSSIGSGSSAQFFPRGAANQSAFGLYAAPTAEGHSAAAVSSKKVPLTAGNAAAAAALVAVTEGSGQAAGSRHRAASGAVSSQGFYPSPPSNHHQRQRFSSGGN